MEDENKVTVAVWEHKHGVEVRVFRDEERAYSWRTGIADEWWETEFPGEERPELDVIGEAYFELMMTGRGNAEFFSIHEATVEGD